MNKNTMPHPEDFGLQEWELDIIAQKCDEAESLDDFKFSDELQRKIEGDTRKSEASFKIKKIIGTIIGSLVGLLIVWLIFGSAILELFGASSESVTVGIEGAGDIIWLILIVGGILVGLGIPIIVMFFVIKNGITETIAGREKKTNYGHEVMKDEEKEQYLKLRRIEYANWLEKGKLREKYYKELEHYHQQEKKRIELENKSSYAYWKSLEGGDGHSFEIAVGELLEARGFMVDVSPIGTDDGIDIIAIKDGKRYAIQCKAQGAKVSPSIARDLAGNLYLKNFDGGMLFALNGVSENTRRVCDSSEKPIEVWDIDRIISYLNG